ncbi:MAG: 2TM domain-containing protein, partial [Candidatus Lokiarchaeota archaeon]|nr:2TM domain-containing protein [Candidatus Lokiarchaeota archaeon]
IYPMAKRSVIYNIDSFIFVMLLLFITNYMTLPGSYWVLFPTIFWGGLVILHLIIYIRYFSTKIENNEKGKSRKERAIEKELEKMRKKQTNRNNR